MDPTLRAFLRANYQEIAASAVSLKELSDAFRATVDPIDWPKGRVAAELARAGYQIGVLDKTAHIAGLAPRHAEWRENGGKLEMVSART